MTLARNFAGNAVSSPRGIIEPFIRNFEINIIALRKLFSILLLCCLLLNVVGYHLIFYFRQQAIKLEMKNLILSHPGSEDENDFIIPISDRTASGKLNWEGDDEFSFDGAMYDVIEKKVENGELVIRALADKRETALVQKYNRINGSRHSDNSTASLVKFVTSQYLQEDNNITFTTQRISLLQNRVQPINISSATHDVLTPPPRNC